MIDPAIALGSALPEADFTWTPSDIQLYNLALGAGKDPLDAGELGYLDDEKPGTLPSFATVVPTLGDTEAPKVKFTGIDIDLAKVVHGSQEIRLHRPIPAHGTVHSSGKIAELWDKGSAAVIVQETTFTDASGEKLWTARSSIFAKGEGGFGGERGPSNKTELPEREPDADVVVATLPQQALLYRMLGDRNPLHSDPEFAQRAGYPAPILHGLCTYGLTCKAVTDTLLDADPSRVTGFRARFAGVLYPGEALRLRMWAGDGEITVVATAPDRDDAPVLGDVVLTHGW
ncbi:MaoC/PaaZ C-terminal domain-containing protein [Nocardia stercoris]|uniref:MaoC/PaaZ C-terminal domain-containing protein n=1 Tax=Nocardia stercoris TaxID=2483361 RepID=UPI001F44A0A3|nr:MaoC/PaaZ C-terminal domain-containing protein [Nocardia stercoris]